MTDDQLDRKGDVGLDVKWGVRPNLTADFTVNTDFAQVEADEEQVNLTRFDLFFPEKRPFFLENASIFQFGAPQQIDLFFSRRIGLSATGSSGVPIDIIGGARLSGKVGGYNIGMLNMQTDTASDARTATAADVSQQFRRGPRSARSWTVELRRRFSSTGKEPAGLAGRDNYNRSYGVDANLQVTTNSKLFAFIARTGLAARPGAARIMPNGCSTTSRTTSGRYPAGCRRSGTASIPRLAICRGGATGGRKCACSFRLNQNGGRGSGAFRRTPATTRTTGWTMACSRRRWGTFISSKSSRSRAAGSARSWIVCRIVRVAPFTVFNAGGKRVIIPPGYYTWYQLANEYLSDPSAVLSTMLRWRHGGFYDGDFNGFEASISARAGSRFIGSTGWTRQNVKLPYGEFPHRSRAGEGQLRVHDAGQRSGARSVQQPVVAVVVEHPCCASQPQRHRIVRRVQRSARHDRLQSLRDARAFVHREVHAAGGLLRSAGRLHTGRRDHRGISHRDTEPQRSQSRRSTEILRVQKYRVQIVTEYRSTGVQTIREILCVSVPLWQIDPL